MLKGFIIIHDEENKGIFAELLFVSYHRSFRVLLIQGEQLTLPEPTRKFGSPLLAKKIKYDW